MPDHPALRRRLRAATVAVLTALAVYGCAQPGTQAPLSEAKLLDEATTAMTNACGYAQELTAFGGGREAAVARYDRGAGAGASKLLEVWRRNRSWLYQGESVNGIVSDSIALLGECGLVRAQRTLRAGISGRR